jgi:hypothetical protein
MGSLSDELMAYHTDRWELIEICRLRIGERIMEGDYDPSFIVFNPDDLKAMQPALLCVHFRTQTKSKAR